MQGPKTLLFDDDQEAAAWRDLRQAYWTQQLASKRLEDSLGKLADGLGVARADAEILLADDRVQAR